MKYSRAHAVAIGKCLVAQDLHRARGGQAFPGSFRGSHSAPFQAPHQHGFADGGAPQGPPDSDPPPGYSTYGPGIGLQRPFGNYMPMGSLGGGYAKPLDMSNNPAMAAMMQQSAPHAHGGGIDENALHHAQCLLEGAKRACGGQISFKSGGEVKESAHVREAKRLLALIDRIDTENPRVSADKRFSYACQRAPGLSRFLKMLLQDGWSRSGARAQIHGALIRWVQEE